jgi:hypothetical protein
MIFPKLLFIFTFLKGTTLHPFRPQPLLKID